MLLFALEAVLWFVVITSGVLLTAVLLTLAVLLFVPVRFRARAEGALHPDDEGSWDGTARWEVEAAWGRFLLKLFMQGTHHGADQTTVTICGLRWPAGKRKERPKPSSEKAAAKKKQRPARKRRRPTADEIRAYINEGIRLVRRLVASLRLQVAGDVRFGFEDPSLTGLTLGLLALTGTPADLRVRAGWLEPGLEGWLSVRGKVYGFEVARALLSAWWRSPLSQRLRQRFTFRFRKQRAKQEVEYHGRAG